MKWGLDYFEKVHERTTRIVHCIPPDKVEWTPREGKFTLGDLARHIAATDRYLFAEVAQARCCPSKSLFPSAHATCESA